MSRVTIIILYGLLLSASGGRSTVVILTRYKYSYKAGISVMTGGNGRSDDCAGGFMSLDRIHAVLNRGELRDFNDNFQALVPGMNFTCSGNIRSWMFGAGWMDNVGERLFTELQIWRSNGDGSYTKVGSTTIMTEENTTQLYEYPLSSPLPFQEGDILGYYQPHGSRSQLRLQFEVGYGHRVYYTRDESSSASHLSMDHLRSTLYQYHALISVETGI